ncbi:hypothetical protein BC833DRAFT_600212 [Globomyces pollinis-pini]|nr:hypothetical protein BC833DRAFT_600212 [Globomyces pollinis-pini]
MRLENEFESLPGKKSLQLIQQRQFLIDKLKKQQELNQQELNQITKPNVENEIIDNEPPVDCNLDTLMIELYQLQQDYLKSNHHQQPHIFKQIQDLKTEIQKLSLPTIEPKVEIDLELELKNLKLNHEIMMLKMDFERERLISQFELQELKSEMMAVQQIPSTPSLDYQQVNWKSMKSTSYDVYSGFFIEWGYLSGVVLSNGSQIQLTYTIFEGNKSYKLLQTHTFQNDFNHHNISLNKKDFFSNIPLKKSIRCVVDLRMNLKNHLIPIGWSTFDLFRGEDLDIGSWKIDIFPHPINFDFHISDVMKSVKPLAGYCLYIRIYNFIQESLIQPLPIKAEESLKEFQSKKILPQVDERGHRASIPEDMKFSKNGQDSDDDDQPFSKKSKKNSNQDTNRIRIMPVVESNTESETAPPDLPKGKKFGIGFQLNDIENYTGVGRLLVRFLIRDAGDIKTECFTTAPSEPSVTAGTVGWEFGLFQELSVVGLPDREGEFEFMEKEDPSTVIGRLRIQVFKFHFSEPFDINDGNQFLPIEMVNPALGSPTINFRIYKPKFGHPNIKKFTPKLITPPISKEAWIANTYILPPIEQRELYKAVQSISVQIDYARFLPDNVTITKITGKIFSPKSKTWIKGYDFSSTLDLDCTVFNPHLTDILEIPISALTDISCMLVFRLYTLDFNLDLRTIGSTFIHLFVDDNTGLVPDKKSLDPYFPNIGNFQIPVYSDRLSKERLLSLETVNELPRVSCTTLLIRIFDSSTENTALSYEHGIYQMADASLPTTSEKHLYPFVLNERKSFTVRNRLLSLGNIPKVVTHTDETLMTWISKQLTLNPNFTPSLIDLSYIAKYEPQYGFKIAVEKGQNLPLKGFTIFVVSFSTNPFETESNKKTVKYVDDFIYSKDLDVSSQYRKPTWKDGYHWYRSRPFDKNLLTIIELFAVIPQDENNFTVQSQGWSILPVFTPNKFVKMGRFQLPLFEGNPNKEVFSYWNDGEAGIDEVIADGAVTLSKRYSSIIVRLCDGRRGDELNDSTTEFNLDYLGSYSAKFKGSSYSTGITSLKPRKMSMEEFRDAVYNAFVEVTNLTYVP